MAKLIKKLSLMTAVLVIAGVSFSFAQEQITLTTIMPSQDTMRARDGAIGSNYRNRTDAEVTDGDLIVEGNLGIGTNNPGCKLDISGGDISLWNESPAESTGIYLDCDNTGMETEIVFQNNSTDRWVIKKTTGNDFVIEDLKGSGSAKGVRLFIEDDNGFVGIGTTGPSGKLQIQNTVGSPTIFDHTDNRNYIRGITYFDSGDKVIFAGSIGIGMYEPGTYKLYVNGNTRVQGDLYVSGNYLPPDYVFDSEYRLESIEEHTEFMWKNKYLKAIPVSKKTHDGKYIINIGAQQTGILEELEKAHIYIAQLKELLDEQEKRIALLEEDKR